MQKTKPLCFAESTSTRQLLAANGDLIGLRATMPCMIALPWFWHKRSMKGSTAMRTYKTEFPHFTAADMPALPAGLVDVSWHNDACPSFEIFHRAEGDSSAFEFVRLWVAEADAAKREFPEGKRFMITAEGDAETVTMLESDDLEAVASYVKAMQHLAARYVDSVGYNPFLDDPAGVTIGEIASTLAEFMLDRRCEDFSHGKPSPDDAARYAREIAAELAQFIGPFAADGPDTEGNFTFAMGA